MTAAWASRRPKRRVRSSVGLALDWVGLRSDWIGLEWVGFGLGLDWVSVARVWLLGCSVARLLGFGFSVAHGCSVCE